MKMGRAPCCEKLGLKKGPWTPEEDQKLVAYIQRHGHGSWRSLPKLAGLLRCGKSCRLRWTNYLRPDIKRGHFSPDEEHTIIQLHALIGNRWSTIATHLPGRTDNEIKNYWNTHLKKRLLQLGIDPVTHRPKVDLYDCLMRPNSSFISSLNHLAQWEAARLEAEARLARDFMKAANFSQPPIDANSQPISADLLIRLLAAQAPYDSMRGNFDQVRNLGHTGSMDLSYILKNWEQSLQSQAPLSNSSETPLPIHNRVVNCINSSSLKSNKLEDRRAPIMAPTNSQPLSPTSTLSCSFVDRQTLPFLENSTSDPCFQSDGLSCTNFLHGAAKARDQLSALHNQAAFQTIGTPQSAMESSNLATLPCNSGQECFPADSLLSAQNYYPTSCTTSLGDDQNNQAGSSIWAKGNSFSPAVHSGTDHMMPVVVSVTGNSPITVYSESSFNNSCETTDNNNALQTGSINPALLLDFVSKANTVSCSSATSSELDQLPVSLLSEDREDYWSNMLKLVGPALPCP